jgi:nucleoside-diphosphate-sugar epimerase
MILITGHKGFIGSKLSEKIPKFFGIDLKDKKDLLKCKLPEKVNVIFHLASQTSVEDSWADPLKDSYNFNMMVRLVKKYPKARIIYAQSAASVLPNSPYGFSKSIAGEYLERFHKNYVICVFPNVYGGGKGVVDIFRSQKKVTIYGDGEQIRDFVHVDDIVEGLLKAQDWPVGEYFMGSGKGVRILDLAQGKQITFAPARKEIRESVLPNTTPDWKPKKVLYESTNLRRVITGKRKAQGGTRRHTSHAVLRGDTRSPRTDKRGSRQATTTAPR